MGTYHDSMERFHKTLRIAMKNEALLMVMDTLIKMAEPRVMVDAKTLSDEITLDDLLEAILGKEQ
jgi:hypothetical protein